MFLDTGQSTIWQMGDYKDAMEVEKTNMIALNSLAFLGQGFLRFCVKDFFDFFSLIEAVLVFLSWPISANG